MQEYRFREVVIKIKTIITGLTADLNSSSESAWLNFQNEAGEYFRVGINPYGAYHTSVMFKNAKNETVMANKIRLNSPVECKSDETSYWKCELYLPWDLLPPKEGYKARRDRFYLKRIFYELYFSGPTTSKHSISTRRRATGSSSAQSARDFIPRCRQDEIRQ